MKVGWGTRNQRHLACISNIEFYSYSFRWGWKADIERRALGSTKSLFWGFGGSVHFGGIATTKKSSSLPTLEIEIWVSGSRYQWFLGDVGGWYHWIDGGDPSANMGTKVEIEKMGCSTRFLRFEPWMSIKEASFRGNTQLLVGSLVFSAPPTLLTLYAREAYI